MVRAAIRLRGLVCGAMDIAQVDRESRDRDAQLEVLVNELLMRLESLERLNDRLEAVENWCERHRYQGHG
jgi:hypothetical protein